MGFDHKPQIDLDGLSAVDARIFAIRRDVEEVLRTPTIAQLRKMAGKRAAMHGRADLVDAAMRAGAWCDMKALKQLLTDDMVLERQSIVTRGTR